VILDALSQNQREGTVNSAQAVKVAMQAQQLAHWFMEQCHFGPARIQAMSQHAHPKPAHDEAQSTTAGCQQSFKSHVLHHTACKLVKVHQRKQDTHTAPAEHIA
jgi:hypothetical protein